MVKLVPDSLRKTGTRQSPMKFSIRENLFTIAQDRYDLRTNRFPHVNAKQPVFPALTE